MPRWCGSVESGARGAFLPPVDGSLLPAALVEPPTEPAVVKGQHNLRGKGRS
ncbi:hypothetical protein I552_3968 [Mycobacterium xenopi 3993]|nr:hypothetical protein I552_3968 [Mycobacterium xenopi 3993]